MSADWPMVPLGEVLTKSRELMEINLDETYKQVTVKLWGQGVVLRNEVSGVEITVQKRLVVRSQQFLLSRIDARNGAFGLVPDFLDRAVVSNDFPAFNLDTSKIIPGFLGWMSKTKAFVDLCRAASEGTTNRVRLKIDRFLDTEIPLPPLDEQRRIVARIEELAARIEEAQKLRRQAAEEAEALVKSGQNEIVERLRQCYLDTRLGDVCTKITDGPHVSPNYVSEGVPFISVRNISESGLDFSTAKYVSPEDHEIFSKKANVERGDVLYTKGGTTGVARRVDIDREFSIWVHVALLKLSKDKVCDGFVEHMLNAPSSKAQALEYTHGSSNKDLGLTRMCNIIFPVPPIDEQRRIVAHLDELQAKVDALKKYQARTGEELDALLPSVLDRAFKWEL